MNSDLQTRDKQDHAVDNSEQYAINGIGDRVLQSADFVAKESKRALEKAIIGKDQLQPPYRKRAKAKQYSRANSQRNNRNYSYPSEETVEDPNHECPRVVSVSTPDSENARISGPHLHLALYHNGDADIGGEILQNWLGHNIVNSKPGPGSTIPQPWFAHLSRYRITERCQNFFPIFRLSSAKTISPVRSKNPVPFSQLMPHLQW